MIQRLKSKYNNKCKYFVITAMVLVLALMGIFLPGVLLLWQSGQQMNVVDAVSVKYYSPANLAVARNASANLGTYQKLQLITGKWESNVAQAEDGESEMADYDAVALAKEQLEALYQEGIYPVSVLSEYGNWYNWDAELCKAIDATFNTYAAYYWKLTFAKYDGGEKHYVYMLEDGTIFLAEARMDDGIDEDALTKISDLGSFWKWNHAEVVIHKLATDKQDAGQYLEFAEGDTDDLQWMALTQLRAAERKYHAVQLYSENHYLYALQPVNE